MGGTMAANRKKTKVQHVLINGNLSKLIAGIGVAGTLGIGGVSYSQSSGANERTAKLETKVEKLEESRKEDSKKLERVDKRTVRMEEYLRLMGNKMGVKQSRDRDDE